MNRTILLLSGVVALMILGACSSGDTEPAESSLPGSAPGGDDLALVNAQSAIPAQAAEAAPKELSAAPVVESGQRTWPDGQPQEDQQGNVKVAIKPLNLNDPGQTIDFEVALNTHSVELGMDLAGLATLTTDNGFSARASLWDAPRGGHHVAGILSFPIVAGGVMLLDEASYLTLTIRDVDAADRSFTWAAHE